MTFEKYRFRLGIAAASLVSGLVALYLHLWKRELLSQTAEAAASGDFEMLQCLVGGGCVLAQTSAWSWFMGVDVALIGTIGYAAILLVSLAGLLPRWIDARWPTVVLMSLIFPAVLFTLRLKYGEFVVLRTFCSWCAVSAIAITLCTVLVLLDRKRLREAASDLPARESGTASALPASHFIG